jgi:hypothetical protein
MKNVFEANDLFQPFNESLFFHTDSFDPGLCEKSEKSYILPNGKSRASERPSPYRLAYSNSLTASMEAPMEQSVSRSMMMSMT